MISTIRAGIGRIKHPVIYPFLFVFYVVFDLLVKNFDQLHPAQAMRPFAILLLVAGSVMLLAWLASKDVHYAGYVTLLFLAFGLVFGHISRLIQEMVEVYHPDRLPFYLMIGWGLLLLVLGAPWLWAKIRRPKRLTAYLNLVFLLVLIPPAIEALSTFASPSQALSRIQGPKAPYHPEEIELECTQRPDIYYIILDGYGREDVVGQLYGYDNAPFLEFLERRGFYLAGQSYTNYMQTVFSLPSALNFAYLDGVDAPDDWQAGREYIKSLTGENRLFPLLEKCGYRTVSFRSGFYFTDLPAVDIYLFNRSHLSEFESLLVSGSPLEIIANKLELDLSIHGYQDKRETVLYAFEQLMELPSQPGPKFVFAHLVVPHPPFVFDQNGNPVQPNRPFSIADGDHFRGTKQEYLQGYRQQLAFVNQMLEQTVDAILTTSQTPPIIILQGDHGPGAFLEWDSPQDTCLWERMAILNAYYLPGGAADYLYESISPVNSFRVVLNNYFGQDLPLLEDRTYFTSPTVTNAFIDVTQQRGSRDNCALIRAD